MANVNIQKMSIEELISYYRIVRNPDDANGIRIYANIKSAQKNLPYINSRKPEILASIDAKAMAKKAAEDERAAKIAAIEGLKEIQAAQAAWEAYNDAFSRSFDSECGRLPEKPTVSVDALTAQYPRAAAYLKAQAQACKANYEMRAIGKRALEKIVEGGDYMQALKDMDAELSKFAEEHLWD